MVTSLLHPHTCGLAKAAIWRFSKDITEKIKHKDNETLYQHRVHSVQVSHQRYGRILPAKKFTVNFKTFQRKLPDLRKKFSTWNPRKKNEHKQYFKAFSADNWKALSVDHKSEHSLTDCHGYFTDIQSTSHSFQSNRRNIAANTTQNNSKIKSTRREYQAGAQKIFD